jgi:HemY protein
MKTELYYSQGEYNKCLQELELLSKKYPKNKNILLQLIAIYKTLANWKSLINLLPKIKKYNIYSHLDYSQLEFTAYQNQLAELAETESINLVMKFF